MTRKRAAVLICAGLMYRMANNKMRKSFSVSTLPLLMKSCFPYSLLLTRTNLPLLHSKLKNAKWESEARRCANSFVSAPSSALLTEARTRTDRFRRVTHLAHIRRKVPFDHTRAKPALPRHCRRLAITPAQHPGTSSHLIWECVLVTNL